MPMFTRQRHGPALQVVTSVLGTDRHVRVRPCETEAARRGITVRAVALRRALRAVHPLTFSWAALLPRPATTEVRRFFSVAPLQPSPPRRGASAGSPQGTSPPSRADSAPKQRRTFQHRRGAEGQSRVTGASSAATEEVHTDFSSGTSPRRRTQKQSSSHHTHKHNRNQNHNQNHGRSQGQQRQSPSRSHPQTSAERRRPQSEQTPAQRNMPDNAKKDVARPTSISAVGKHTLEHLLRTHETTRQNYAALNKDERVVEAFSHVCLAVVRETLDNLLSEARARDQCDAEASAAAASEVSALRVFFDSTTSGANDSVQQCSFRLALSTPEAPLCSALVSPIHVPTLAASEFFELLGRLENTPPLKSEEDGTADALSRHAGRVIEECFVAPLTQRPTAAHTTHDERDEPACYYWPFHDALQALWLTPSSVRSGSSAAPAGQPPRAQVDAALTSPAAREAWRRERAHDLVQLMNTVTFFKWLKDEQVLTSASTSANTAQSESDAATRASASFMVHLDNIRDARGTLRTLQTQQRHLADTAPSSDRIQLAKQRLAASQQVLAHAQAIYNLVPKVDETTVDIVEDHADAHVDETAGAAVSMHVFDVLLMLLLRALLPLWPTAALSSADRAAVFRVCTLPWFATVRDTVCLPLARWLTFLQLSTVLPSSTAAASMKPSEARTTTAAVQATTAAAPLEGELPCVQLLRLLCWPNCLDEDSNIVDRALDRSTAAAPPPPLKELLAVLNSSEARQRLAYDLLYVLFSAQEVPQGPVHALSGAAERVLLAPHLLRSHSVYLRTVSALCVYVLDADRFMSERVSTLPQPCTLLFAGPNDAAPTESARAAAQREAVRVELARQARVPGALSRHVFLSLRGADLAALWSAMARKRAAWLWEAYLRAVAPLCLVLLGANPPPYKASSVHGDEDVWQNVAPVRAQLLASPNLQNVLAQFLVESLSEATGQATACAEQPLTLETPTAHTPASATPVTPADSAETATAAQTRLSTTHLLHLASLAALLLEVQHGTVTASTSAPASPADGSASPPTLSAAHRELGPQFERCLRAYLQQPLPPSPQPDAAATTTAPVDRTESKAEAALMALVDALDARERASGTAPPQEKAEARDTLASATTTMSTVLGNHLLTPALRADVRVRRWQREQAARRRRLVKPVEITQPILRQWHERLWESEMSGVHAVFPVNAARVYEGLAPLLLDEATASALTLDELQTVLDVLVHLHTRAGLQLTRTATPRATHHHASASSSRSHPSESVFALMAQAVCNEASQNAHNKGLRGHHGTTSAVRPAQVEDSVARMERVLLAQLDRAMQLNEDAPETTGAAMRRVPLSLWLNAIVLGLISVVSLQPGVWPSTIEGAHVSGHARFADPRQFFLSATSPCGAPVAQGEEGESRVPSFESWCRAFQDAFRLRRSVRLTSGLVLHRNTVFLDPTNGGWQGLYLDRSDGTELVFCAHLSPPGDRSTASADVPQAPETARRTTQQLLRFLQHELMQSELAEAALASPSGAIASTSEMNNSASIFGFTGLNAFAFAEEDGMKEFLRGYARLYVLATFFQTYPLPAATARSVAGEQTLYLLLLRVLFDLQRAKPSSSTYAHGAHRLASDALLSLAMATQRLRLSTAVDDDASKEADGLTDETLNNPGTGRGMEAATDSSGTRTPRLPPLSPTRLWASRVLPKRADVDKEVAADDAAPTLEATVSQCLAEALSSSADSPTTTTTVATDHHDDERRLSEWLQEATLMRDPALLRRAAIAVCAMWLPPSLEALASVHAHSVGAALSTRSVVALLVAVSVLRDSDLVPRAVAQEVSAQCAQVLHRLTEDRRVAARQVNLFLTAALVAPRTSTCLLPVAQHLREARDQLSLVEVVRALAAMTVAAYEFESLHDAQADRQAEEAAAVEVPMVLMTSAAPAVPVPASASASSSSFTQAEPRLGVGNARLASVPSGRSPPPALRGAWLALSRRLLSREAAMVCTVSSEAGLSTTGDVRQLLAEAWSHALACGAALGCADSEVFGQLIATLIYGGNDDDASEDDTGDALVAHLSLRDWARVLVACRGVPDIQRDELTDVLREPLLAFVNATAQSSSPVVCQDVCLFLEALPVLFVESAFFWRQIHAMTARASGSATTPAARDACWQSYNWAVQSAGHLSLQTATPS